MRGKWRWKVVAERGDEGFYKHEGCEHQKRKSEN